MAKKKNIGEHRASSQETPCAIVAIGASAGGLEAITELLKHLPPDTGMAYFYIQHLDPNHESMLTTILARSTSMPVIQASEAVPIAPDHLFIIPPDKNIALVDGHITLTARKPKPVLNMPIDDFLISLADTRRIGSIGIILSGTGMDGTLGLQAIKFAGGLTFAQDNSARFLGMPNSAIAENVVDMVLPPESIAKELARLGRQADLMAAARLEHDEEEQGSASTLKDPHTERDYMEIISLLKKDVRVDFTHYKHATVRRRILRRMLLQKMETLADYSVFLKRNPKELGVLYQDMLINVTNFFRDEDTIEFLKKTLIPGIINNKAPGEGIRIWVPACATGEEAYSLAIIILEIFGDDMANMQVQIFATDLSEPSIARARLGIYTRHALHNVSAQRLQKYFTKTDGTYRIAKRVRDLCVFAPHNILTDPPFSRLDLISCCNLFIYLDTLLQKKILSVFYYALNATGCLVLGKSETITASGSQLFAQIEKKFRAYSKTQEAGGRLAMDHSFQMPFVERSQAPRTNNMVRQQANAPGLEKVIDELLLSHYVPACVVINQDMEILQFRGSTGIFLEPSPGRASLNLLKMARTPLALELQAAIHNAKKQHAPVKKSGVAMKVNNVAHTVAIEVVPLKSQTEERLFLVIFELDPFDEKTENETPHSKDKVVTQLQSELEVLKEDMRSILEEQEASNEELQSANEEITSSNEELQSMNEELETAKEEVESANEELMTINMELQVRNEQLTESYEYADALLQTISEAVVVLSTDFQVRMANEAFYKIFKVRESDTEGKQLFELGNRQWDVLRLRQLLDDVVRHNKTFEAFKIEHDFPVVGRKVMLMNARKIIQAPPKQDIILITIDDITEFSAAQKMNLERETWFRNMADNAPVMIWVSDKEKNFAFFNTAWLEYTGRKLTEETGNGWMNNVHEEDVADVTRVFNESFDKREPFHITFRLRRQDGEYCKILNKARPGFSSEGEFTGYVGSCVELPSELQ